MIACSAIYGIWTGIVQDNNHLFTNPVHITLALKNLPSKRSIIGYIANRSKPYNCGDLIIAACTHQHIQSIHIISTQLHCQTTALQPKQMNSSKLTLTLPYSNAMIDTSFTGEFKHARMTMSVNQKWMEDARQINLSRVHGCH